MNDLVAYFRELDEGLKLAATQAFRIFVILLLAWVLQALAARLIRLFRNYMSRRTGGDEIGRVETLARVFRNAAAIVIVLVAGMLILGDHMLGTRHLEFIIPGPQAHWAKLAFEKYFMYTRKHGHV